MRNNIKVIDLLVEMALLDEDEASKLRYHEIRGELAMMAHEATPRDLESRISDLLLEMGISASLTGFRYLKTALQKAYDDPSFLDHITKRLYPEVAKEHGTTTIRVERAMRHAIETAYDRGDADLLARVMGNTVSPYKGKPTNSEFISIVVERMKQKEL